MPRTPPMTATLGALPSGRASAFATIKILRQLVTDFSVNPEIIQTARNIVANLPPYETRREVDAVFRYVRDQIRYVKDVHAVETISDPLTTLAQRAGDCDDKASLLGALLQAIGYPVRFVMAGYRSADFEHVYLQVWISDEWVTADAAVAENLGFEGPFPRTYWIERV